MPIVEGLTVSQDAVLIARRLREIADAIRGSGGASVAPDPKLNEPPSGTWVASGNPDSDEVGRAVPKLDLARRNGSTDVVIDGRLWVWHSFEGEHSV